MWLHHQLQPVGNQFLWRPVAHAKNHQNLCTYQKPLFCPYEVPPWNAPNKGMWIIFNNFKHVYWELMFCTFQRPPWNVKNKGLYYGLSPTLVLQPVLQNTGCNWFTTNLWVSLKLLQLQLDWFQNLQDHNRSPVQIGCGLVWLPVFFPVLGLDFKTLLTNGIPTSL